MVTTATGATRFRPIPLTHLALALIIFSIAILPALAGAQGAPRYNPLKITSISPSSVSVLSGQTVQYTVKVSGGSPSTYYYLTVADQYGNQLSATTFPFTSGVTSSIRIAENNTNSSPASYLLTFTLNDDARDAPANGTAVLTVAGAGQSSLPRCGTFQPGQFSINVTPASATTLSGTQQFEVSVAGATCAYGLTIEDHVSGRIYGSATGITAPEYNASVQETVPGTYLVRFLARDYAGRNASDAVLLTYSGTPQSTPSSGSTSGGGGLAGQEPLQLQSLCGFLRSVMLVLGVALLIFGLAVFVGTWMIPGRVKGPIHRYGLWAIAAGIICLAIGIAAPYLPNPIAMPGVAGAVNPIC
ncbi:MAG: hypothetical protein KGH58_01925 [Candidatus Micrarchaeota archaeon]|nr:hypothetical protein [Candidatus Micrarchaeota archaeon]